MNINKGQAKKAKKLS